MKQKDLSILVVEDKSVLAQDVIDRLELFGYTNIIGPFPSGEEALKACEESLPDLAILDIQLRGNMTGIDVAKLLNQDDHVPVIYLTQQQDDETFKHSMSTFPVSFINKPFTNNELRSSIVNAVRSLGEEPKMAGTSDSLGSLKDRIFIRNGKGKYFIKLDNILWIQSNGGDTSSIMTKEHQEESNKPLPVVALNLSRLEGRLSFYPYLIRASRYYIVNLKNVERILDHQPPDRTTLKKALQVGEEEIVIGDKYRKDVMDKFVIV